MAPSKPKTGERMTPASDAGQKPPTEANPVRQRYQMGCHEGGNPAAARIKTRSRQFNRGSGGGGY